MTTKVLIVNHGPDEVLVSVINATDRTKTPGTLQQRVRPTESNTFYVHGTSALLLEEIKRESSEG